MADTQETAPALAEDTAQEQQQEQQKAGEDTQGTAAESGAAEAEADPQEEDKEGEAGGEEKQEGEGDKEAEPAAQEQECEQPEAEQEAEEAAAPEEQQEQREVTEQTQKEETTEAADETQQQNATGEQQQEQGEQEETQNKEEASKDEDVIHENGEASEGQEAVSDEAEEKPASQMSEEDKEKCRKFFEKKAHDGRLDLKGFKILFRLMGEVLSTEDADSMFQEGDADDNGTIDFSEFCRLYTKFSQAEQERKCAVAGSIEKLFPTSDGQPVELRKVESLLMKLQRPDLSMRLVKEKSDLGQDDVRRLVISMDKDGNGLISKTEFVETLCGHLQM